MHWNSERTGITYSIAHMLLWGLFPVFAKSTFTSVSPLWSVGIGVLTASILFAVLLSFKREWHALIPAIRSKGVWANTVFNGTLYYICFYIGLRSTTAGNASIVALFEVLTTIVILGIVRQSERMTTIRIIGAFLILFGVFVILLRNAALPRGGELLILFATFLVPLGNLAGKDALRLHSAIMVLFVRSIVSGVFLCLLAWFMDGIPERALLLTALPTILFTGVFLLGLGKVFWMESMARIQIAMGVSIGSLTPVIALLAGVIFLNESIQIYHFIALIPVLIGIRLIFWNMKPMNPVSLEV